MKRKGGGRFVQKNICGTGSGVSLGTSRMGPLSFLTPFFFLPFSFSFLFSALYKRRKRPHYCVYIGIPSSLVYIRLGYLRGPGHRIVRHSGSPFDIITNPVSEGHTGLYI